ncbi:glycosyltransferase family 4 protein [Iningainema tapete]|uniref:Glycosyltransferase family 4 protein n=1 Tax=Iningainema tapete BLCC-T55 TaxID=2748662 RepID=A0A8J7BZJ8_9CYAN|nr:glycosyltransferase family 4 protein [Iningainema tapete]MBD2776043.1 glycosyltransferase family 4 protein [Iningainema tapete BLCC-T55]
MKIKNIVVTGESPYLFRHEFLFQAMSSYCENLQIIQRKQEWYEQKMTRRLLKYLYALRVFSVSKADTLFQKNQREFIAKSQRIEQEIRQMPSPPELVFHIFNTYSPIWNKYDIPYVVYLDYTMVLSEKKQLPWAYFINRSDRNGWFECERQLFQRATHLFAQSNCVKTSLLQDYGIEPKKVTVVGASGDFQAPYEGEKNFGSQQILFNGSDFKRKGGDLVLAAFKKVRQILPEAKLVIIGRKLPFHEDGIDNPGHISRSQLQNLFLNTDLVLAPAYCDPFPRFVMEAMNYGIPCIVSANDGMPEIVEHKVNGIVIEQPTSELLANQIVDLISNPSVLASMSQAARFQVRTKLNWNNIANNIVQVLSTIK